MVNRAQMTYVVFSFQTANGGSRYLICAFNHLTQTIVWIRQVSIPNPNAEIAAADLAIDAAGTTLVLAGTFRNAPSGTVNAYAASVSAATGALNWHRRYVLPGYRFEATSVFVQGTAVIYVAGVMLDAANMMNRGVVVLALNTTGALLNRRMLRYSAPCIGNRLGQPTVKRTGNRLIVVANSVLGPSSSGAFLIAKLDPFLNLTAFSAFTGALQKDTRFQLVNNDQRLTVHGVSTLLLTATPGFARLLFDVTATPSFVRGRKYTFLDTAFTGPAAAAAYHPPSNEIVTMVGDPNDSTQYYHVRSGVDGAVGCDLPYAHGKSSCQVLASTPTVLPALPGGTLATTKLANRPIKITDVAQSCRLPADPAR
jgi:hypothetical protein